ncbi:DUF2171 domain-containing protein [Hyphomicrobium sp.]|uniref:DUF2171 domain-containing protein n=1 Tax=Hyphomicrobium sp. TaxID=82 RepID=UPI0039C8696E
MINTTNKTRKPASLEKTPESASDKEVTERADEAVRDAVTVKHGAVDTGMRSVLPGPPIPPSVQAEISEEQEPRKAAKTNDRRGPPSNKKQGVKEMIDSSQIKEHMEVVGSDGEHVGTVDHCEGADVIKLTKNDPAADGKHHYIPLGWVKNVDRHVHLAHPAAEVMRNWG